MGNELDLACILGGRLRG